MSLSTQERLTANWLLLHAVAIPATTFHAIIDWHIGLFGATSAVMTPAQAGVAFGMSLLTAFWAVGLGWAAREEARGHATAFVVSLLWGFVGNGVPIAACPPPCSGAFPYGGTGWVVPGIVTGITVVVFVLEASLSL